MNATAGRVWMFVLCVLLGFVSASCRREGVEKDPVTQVNAPRPTNQVAKEFPGVTNPPPR